MALPNLAKLAKLGGKVTTAVPKASKSIAKGAKTVAKSSKAKKIAKATAVTGAVGAVGTGVYLNSRDNGGIIGTTGPSVFDLNPVNLVPKSMRDAGDALGFLMDNAVPLAAGVGVTYLYFTVVDRDPLGAVGAGAVTFGGASMLV